MHEPSDSSLLWDAVRVMTRLLEQACALAGRAAISWRDHRRLAKKRAHAIQHSRGKERKVKLYRELIAATRATKLALERALVVLAACAEPTAADWCGEVRHYLPLIERIMTRPGAGCSTAKRCQRGNFGLDPVYSVGDFVSEVRPNVHRDGPTGLFGRTVLLRMREASSHMRISSRL